MNLDALLLLGGFRPKSLGSPEPVIDDLTRKLTATLRRATMHSDVPGDVSICRCDISENPSYYKLHDGTVMPRWWIHYLAFHRDEIPDDVLRFVRTLDCGEEAPNEQELNR